MLESKLLERLRAWGEQRNAMASLWLFGSRAKGTAQQGSDYDFAIELRPTRRTHDWALADYVANCDLWNADLSKMVRADVRLVAFRDQSDRPFDLSDGFLIWERTKPSAEVK
jgi:predicted nucleotidyltransferase